MTLRPKILQSHRGFQKMRPFFGGSTFTKGLQLSGVHEESLYLWKHPFVPKHVRLSWGVLTKGILTWGPNSFNILFAPTSMNVTCIGLVGALAALPRKHFGIMIPFAPFKADLSPRYTTQLSYRLKSRLDAKRSLYLGAAGASGLLSILHYPFGPYAKPLPSPFLRSGSEPSSAVGGIQI